MTPLDIAQSTLMALRPIGADYLGADRDGSAFRATVREIDGTERHGVGPTELLAVRALIGWYSDSSLSKYKVIYDPVTGHIEALEDDGRRLLEGGEDLRYD